jgi:hypothetical protein
MNLLKKIKLAGLMVVLFLSPFLSHTTSAQPGVSVPIESFYDELAPYGQWIQHPGYGYVWLPNAGPNFQPYASAGHWVVTEYGNTWVSDYPWGWAPFHYGRWIFDQAFGGWLWIPGSDWGPAWVSWRSGNGYYGWAPLAPGWDINVNINIPAPYWTFVPQVYITSPNLYSYYLPRPQVINIYQNTTIINNYYRTNNRAYVYGPPRGEIERYARHSVPVYRIDPMDRPGRSVVGNGSVGFYRPGGAGGYRQDYSRNDRYNRNDGYTNTPRSGYNGNPTPNRGYNGSSNYPGRDYNGNMNNTPNRDNSGNGWNRDYNRPSDRGGSYNNNPTPNPTPNAASQPNNRPEPNRGGYTPGNTQQPQSDNGQSGGYTPRSFPQGGSGQFGRPERAQPQINSNPQPMNGERREGAFGRMQESSRSQAAQQQGQGQPQGQRSGGFGGGERQRGPR